MIDSGTHTPDITAAMFELPAHSALRYERVDPRLAGYVADYHVLDSEEGHRQSSTDWMLPSWPAIRIILSPRTIAITLDGTTYDPMPAASLYGTTSQAMRVVTQGGVTVGASITPLGWAQLFDIPADRLRDRIVPLQQLFDPAAVDALVADLAASDQGPAVKAILDAFFVARIGPPHRAEDDIRTLLALLMNDEVTDLATAAANVGIGATRLRRLSARYFGFPPKPLLMRARFLRSFLPIMLRQGHHAGPVDYAMIDSCYCDLPHFLRDADRFLGMTPKRFLELPNPYLRACLRARTLVMGTPTQAVGGTDPAETGTVLLGRAPARP